MQIKKGRDRIVLILPFFGIVIKLPISHPISVIKFFFFLIKDRKSFIKDGIKRIFFRFFTSRIGYGVGNFKDAMFGGMYSNWLEYLFWKRTKNPFLKPTYFSLFGLLNIQKYGKLCELEYIDFWFQLRELTKENVYDNPHHFSNPKNFTLENGKLQLVDYGSVRVYRVIAKYGRKIATEFNPDYKK